MWKKWQIFLTERFLNNLSKCSLLQDLSLIFPPPFLLLSNLVPKNRIWKEEENGNFPLKRPGKHYPVPVILTTPSGINHADNVYLPQDVMRKVLRFSSVLPQNPQSQCNHERETLDKPKLRTIL